MMLYPRSRRYLRGDSISGVTSLVILPIKSVAVIPEQQQKWHLDEMRLVIKKEVFWLWRAVEQEDNVLDILMHRRRNKAAKRLAKFLKKLLKKQGFAPRVMVTDQLKSYAAAKKEILPTVEHRYSQRLEQSCSKLPSTNTLKGKEAESGGDYSVGVPQHETCPKLVSRRSRVAIDTGFGANLLKKIHQSDTE